MAEKMGFLGNYCGYSRKEPAKYNSDFLTQHKSLVHIPKITFRSMSPAFFQTRRS